MFTTLERITKSGVKTFLRNGFLSASSVLVMVITMLIILGMYFSTVLLGASITQVENKVDINIFFEPDAPIGDVLEFKKLVEELPSVDMERTNYVSKEDSLIKFREKHKDEKIYEEVLNIVDNPLGAVLNVKAKNINNYSEISNFIEGKDVQKKYGSIINNLNYRQNKQAIEKLNVLIEYTYKIGSVLALILIMVSLIVTFNTMRLIIYTFKEEISIMRLVGASKFFARGPFVIEGILYGIISGIFSLFISWSVVFYSTPYLQQIFILNLNEFFSDNIFKIAGVLILGGIILGFTSTYLAVSKYLKV